MSDESEFSGSAVLLVDRGGRVLLQQRDDAYPPPGYGRWAIPGGRREGAETPRETAVRELREETGLKLRRLRLFTTATPERYPGLVTERLAVFFADDEVDEAVIVVNEGLAFRFFAPAEIDALPMHAATRAILADLFASDLYRGTLSAAAPYREGVAVLALDRWGRVLLQLRDADLPPERHPDTWSLPGGYREEGEAPDACALREFEEETGLLLDELRLFRVYRRSEGFPDLAVDVQHVYFIDADIAEDAIDVREGQAFRYFAQSEMAGLPMPSHARRILAEFFESPGYRGLFH